MGKALIFGDPIHDHNMTLVPVSTTKRGPFARYTLLEAGLEAKTLAVREMKGKAAEFFMRGRSAKRAAPSESVKAKNYKKKAKQLIGTETVDDDTGERVRETYIADD